MRGEFWLLVVLVGCLERPETPRDDATALDATPPMDVGLPDAEPPDASTDLGGEAVADAGVDAAPPPPPCTDVRDFNALSQVEGDGFSLFDLTTDLDTVQATCGGPGAEATYRFVAPAAGTWLFLATPDPGHDPLLHARRTCDDPTTELACHADLPGEARARIHLDLAAGEQVFVFVDSENSRGGFFTLTAQPVPPRLAEEACDPAGLQDACPAGFLCSTVDDPPRCAPNAAPEITGPVRAARHADGVLGLVFSGRDTSRDARVAWVQFFARGEQLILDPARGANTWQVTPDPAIFGIADFEFRLRARAPGPFHRADKLRVQLRDDQAQTSAWTWVRLEEAEVLQPLQTCDPQALFAGCPPDAPCRRTGKSAVCTWLRGPVIEAATGTAGPEGLGLRLRVTDPDGDAATVQVSLPDGTVLEADLAPALSWRTPAPVGPATVTVTDRTGRISPAVEVELTPAPERSAGEPCDITRGFDTCTAPHSCVGDPPTCQVISPDCPPETPIIDVVGGEGRWSYFGDSTGAPNFARGSCGGGAGQVIHRFMPPDDGPYYFSLWSGADRADPVLTVRTHCAVPGTSHPELEVGCNDDSWGLESRLLLDLVGGESVYVVVDGFGGGEGWHGPYVLQINEVQ